MGNCPWGNFIGQILRGIVVRGKLFRGNFPGGKSMGVIPGGNFLGNNCPGVGGAIGGGNVRTP